MSFNDSLRIKDTKAIAFGLPDAPVASATIPQPTKVETPAIKAKDHAIISTATVPVLMTAQNWGVYFTDVWTGFAKGGVMTSNNGRVGLCRRNITYGGVYGDVTLVAVDGTPRTKFSNYPVHFLKESDLTSAIHANAEGRVIPLLTGLEDIKSMRLQLDGKLIKVLQDSDSNLCFIDKTKAEVGPANRALLMTTLARSYMERTGETDFNSAAFKVFNAMMGLTNGGMVATFRLIHPDVVYVRGAYDLSKNSPVAVCVAIETMPGTEYAMNATYLTAENRNVIVLPEDIYDQCNLDSFGAVMVNVFDAKLGIRHHAKLVSEEHRERHRLVEGINGNFSVHLVRAGIENAPAIHASLDPVHWPAFDEAVQKASARTTDGPAIVARFLERNYRALCTDKSPLVSALCKMDVKMAQKLVSGAKLFNPKRSAAAFVQGMKPEMRDSHARLLTEVVEKKLTHSNPDVSAAARLVKEHC